MERLTLVLPDPAWERQAEDYRQAYLDSGECHINGSSAMERYPVYSEWLDRINALQKLPVSQEHTPATTFFAVREQVDGIMGIHSDAAAVDRRAVPHAVGISVTACGRTNWKKGYASQMLTLALDFCRKIGLERVLLDCRADNAASERTIRKCGGISAGEVQVPGDDGQPERIRRFWIAL